MTLRELLSDGKKFLEENDIYDGDLISKMIAEYIIKLDRSKLIIYNDMEIDSVKCLEYKEMLNKIVSGVPVQYITNNQEFMKLNFYVDENVLIPQPDTELIVEEVIDYYHSQGCKILDLCTGSGAIGVSLAKYIEKSN